MKVPAKLQRLANYPTGPTWLGQLPQLLSNLGKQWGLEMGDPYEGSNVSYVCPAVCAGRQVVLKVQWPQEECEHEADALRVWNGDGAVKPLAHDIARSALLLEHCSPGTPLSESEKTDQLSVLIDLLPRLWKPAGAPFRTLAREAEAWRATLVADWKVAKQPFGRRFVDAASDYLVNLPARQGARVLIHEDLHGENALAAQRAPWLAIDPEPLLGEREFALAPI